MERGLVTGIVWPSRYAFVTKGDGTPVKASWLTGWPPPPRTVVWLEQPVPGVWLIVGCEAYTRATLHDDFNRANPDFPAAVTLADTNWWGPQGFPGVVDADNTATSDMGVMKMATTANINEWMRLTKSEGSMRVPSPVPAAVWISSRIKFSTLTDTLAMIGLGNNANQAFAVAAPSNEINVGYDSAVTPGFASARYCNNGANNQVGSTIPIVANTFYHFDLLVQAGGAPWSAYWVDGQGPVINRLNVPITALQCHIQVYNRGAASRTLHVDWYHAEFVSAVIAP